MGGSSWSAAARCGTKIATATVKAIRLTNLRACFLIPHSLLKLERSRFGLAPRTSFLGRLGFGPECRCSKYALYRNRAVSGTFGMSNQERPDLLQAIKHLRGRRVVKDSRRAVQRLGTHGIGMARWKSKRPAPRLERAFCVRARISVRGGERCVNRHRYCANHRSYRLLYGS